MREAEKVWKGLEAAVDRFNRSNDRQSLLCPLAKSDTGSPPQGPAASERAITYRLAFYLESELRGAGVVCSEGQVAVDCEYNRHLGAKKALAAEEELKGIVVNARRKTWDNPDEEGFFVFSIAPDVVVHERGNDDRNLLVIEVKKRSNKESPEYDDLKLKLFTRPRTDEKKYGYALGAAVVAEDEVEPGKRCLRTTALYENGKCVRIF